MANASYVTTSASPTTIQLPESAEIGAVVQVTGAGTGVWSAYLGGTLVASGAQGTTTSLVYLSSGQWVPIGQNNIAPGAVAMPLLGAQPVIAFIGDSITAAASFLDSYPASGTDAIHGGFKAVGFPAWARIMSGNRFIMANYGASGQTVQQMIARVDEACSLNPAIVVVHAGTNNCNWGESAATIFGRLQTLCELIRAKGITVILTTLTSASTAQPSYANWAVIPDLNKLIRNYCNGANRPILCDWGMMGMDAIGPYHTGTSYFYDALHPNTIGAQIAGKRLADLISSLLPANLSQLPLSLDGKSGSVVQTTNPWMTGSVSQSEGTMATGFRTYIVHGNATVTGSKAPRNDGLPGEYQRLVITTSGTGVLNDYVTLQTDPITGVVVGDSVFWAVKVRIVGGTFYKIGASAYDYNHGFAWTLLHDVGSASPIPYDLPAGYEFWLVSNTATIAAGTTSIFQYFTVAGNGTIDVGPWLCLKP